MAAVVLSGNLAIFSRQAVRWLLCWSYSHVLFFVLCWELTLAILLPFHYCWIVICFIDYHWHSLGSGQGLPWPGEGCSAKGARPPAAAVDAQPRHTRAARSGSRSWWAARAKQSKGFLSQPENMESTLSDNFQLRVKPK